MVNNKQLMYTAPTVHSSLPFCIALCSVDLFGLVVVVVVVVVVVGHGPVVEFDNGAGV